jgi:hypothetical protein
VLDFSLESQGTSQKKNVFMKIVSPILANRNNITQAKYGGYICLRVVPLTNRFLEAFSA